MLEQALASFSFYLYDKCRRPMTISPVPLLCVLLALAGCEPRSPAITGAPAPTVQAAGWPRVIDTEHGPVRLERAPLRIVSTSVTLTGTLLALDAPVIGSGATQASSSVSDKQGFFTQWGALASERGVKALYRGEPDAEAIAAAEPDLILVAATGGDSALKLHEQLAQVAPVLVVNYDDKSWQELAQVLGKATGREANARALVARFAAEVATSRARLRLPPQPTTAMVYYEDGSGANVFTANSAQGKLLQDLGFALAPVPAAVQGNTSMGVRSDVVEVGGEKFAQGVQGQTVLLFSAEAASEALVKRNPFLLANSAVREQRVHAVGLDTFRLDYYSAHKLLGRLEQLFPVQP
jgi:ABC-type Fe2+-enterobactin transport system substrate-binding protein